MCYCMRCWGGLGALAKCRSIGLLVLDMCRIRENLLNEKCVFLNEVFRLRAFFV